VINLDARRCYFELSNSPNVIWIDLKDIDLSPGQPLRVLDPDDPSLWGQVNARMQAGPAPFQPSPAGLAPPRRADRFDRASGSPFGLRCWRQRTRRT
jgi:hypothetical protein